MTNRPLFIGNFRSGTTLLVNLLGLHPAVAPWFETKALCEPLRWMRVLQHPELAELEASLIRLPGPPGFSAEAVAGRMLADFRETAARVKGVIPSGKGSGERYPIGHDHVLYDLQFAEHALEDWLQAVGERPDAVRIGQATGILIRCLGNRHAYLAGKSCWINKTPEIGRFAAELRACLGPVGMLLMIRDGREVVRSAMRLGWAAPEELGIWWQGMIEQSRVASAIRPDDYMELRYEDLLADPVASVDRVLRFVGLAESGMDLVARYQADFPLSRPLSPNRDVNVSVPDYLDAEFMQSLGYH
jgi:Sulfotransferase domain.